MASVNQPANPYVGPRPFSVEDKERFFGREREIDDLVNLTYAYNVVLLNAQSGAGKSSLLNAGVIPRLTHDGHHILQARIRDPLPESITKEPGSNFFVFKTLVSWNENRLKPSRFVRTKFRPYLQTCESPVDSNGEPSLRVLVFDQFEDLFTFHLRHWEDRRGFFEQLGVALRRDPQLRLILAMREEYVSRLGVYSDLLPGKLRVRYYLEHLRHDASVQAITKPLTGTGRSFSDDAANDLARELSKIRVEARRGEPDMIPGEFVEPVQLQIVCQNLWEHWPSGASEIQSKDVKELGDVNEALSDFYQRTIKTTVERTQIDEEMLRGWFDDHLITEEGTPGIVYQGREDTGGIPNDVANMLEDLRLIRQEPRAGVIWYELSHDRFVKPIRDSNRVWRQQQERQRGRRRTQILAYSLVGVILVTLVILGLTIQNNASRAADATAIQANQQLQGAWVATRVLGFGGVPTIELTLTPFEIFQGTATAQAQTVKQQSRVINGVDMVFVPAGCFWMGYLSGEADEKPIFNACIRSAFWIDQYEVTNEQFSKYPDKKNPAPPPKWIGPQMPRTNVTWQQALDYCSARYPNGGTLPNEMQWEYAARGWNSYLYPWGNIFVGDVKHVIYGANSTEPKSIMADPNDASDISRSEGISWIGAFDMVGNVREWTTTFYDQANYADLAVGTEDTSPKIDSSDDRVVRGGSYFSPDVTNVTTTQRSSRSPNVKYEDVGFRCILPFGAETNN